jgi:hypothetical protein
MTETQTARRSLLFVGILAGVGLVLQFYLSLQLSLANGRTVPGQLPSSLVFLQSGRIS